MLFLRHHHYRRIPDIKFEILCMLDLARLDDGHGNKCSDPRFLKICPKLLTYTYAIIVTLHCLRQYRINNTQQIHTCPSNHIHGLHYSIFNSTGAMQGCTLGLSSLSKTVFFRIGHTLDLRQHLGHTLRPHLGHTWATRSTF